MKNITSIILILAGLVVSCNSTDHEMAVHNDKPVQIDNLQGRAVYATHDQNDNAVLSWARIVNDSVSEFCYARSSDGGKTFGAISTIPASNDLFPHSENIPKIIFKPSGTILAVWGRSNPGTKNKYAGLVSYSQSFDNGITWTSPVPLVNDTSGNDQRYYDLALAPDGEVAIIWLDDRKTGDKEGSALYFAKTNGRSGFEKERKIAEGCCQCCRTKLLIDSKNNIHVLYRGILKDSIRDMVHQVSRDGGKTFSEPRLISNDNWVLQGCPHTGPSMTESNGAIHFAWFTGARNKGCHYTNTNDNGASFKPAEKISAKGSHPQITDLDGNATVTVWDEAGQKNGQPFKKIGVEYRTSDRSIIRYITGDDEVCTYPVIVSTGKGSAVIAYQRTKDEKSQIMSQRISFH